MYNISSVLFESHVVRLKLGIYHLVIHFQYCTRMMRSMNNMIVVQKWIRTQYRNLSCLL